MAFNCLVFFLAAFITLFLRTKLWRRCWTSSAVILLILFDFGFWGHNSTSTFFYSLMFIQSFRALFKNCSDENFRKFFLSIISFKHILKLSHFTKPQAYSRQETFRNTVVPWTRVSVVMYVAVIEGESSGWRLPEHRTMTSTEPKRF